MFHRLIKLNSKFMQPFMCCVIWNKCFSSSSYRKNKTKQLNLTHLSFSSSSGPPRSSFQSATWCWSPATPVTCPAVWTGSTSRSMRPKITWWFCARRRWPPNRIDSCLELTHRENRPSRHLNTDTNMKGMKICPFYPWASVRSWYLTGTYSASQTHHPVQIKTVQRHLGCADGCMVLTLSLIYLT